MRISRGFPEDGTQRMFEGVALAVLLVGALIKSATVHSWMYRNVEWAGVVLDASMIVAILLLVYALGRRHRLAAASIASLVVSIWLMVTVIYVLFFGQMLTVRIAVGSAVDLGQVLPLVPSLVMKRYALLFIDSIIVVGLLVWARLTGISADRPAADSTPQRTRLVVSGALAVMVVGLAYAAASSVAADQLLLGSHRGVIASQVVSSLPQRQAVLPSFEADFAGRESVERAVEGLLGPERSRELLGAYSESNVIIVIAEGLQAMVVDETLGGQELTPSLGTLLEDSFYFPLTFSQVGKGNTSDAEFTMNTGWYSPPGLAPSMWYSDRILPSLPRELGRMGYTTATFHTNEASFWSRDEMYPALGFDRYFDRDDFDAEELYLGWGAHDEVLYTSALPHIVEMHQSDAPFMVELVTLSSHFPFDPVPEFGAELVIPEAYEDTVVGDYLQAVHYADHELGSFVDELHANGVLEDTILVIVGDHGAIFSDEEGANDLARDLKNREYQAPDYLNVPLIIRPPGGVEPISFDRTVGHVDLPATVLGMLGADDYVSLGRSAFSEHTALLPTRGRVPSGSFATDEYFYVAGLTEQDGLSLELPELVPGDKPTDIAENQRRARELMGLSRSYLESLQPRGAE